jgi:two-component system, sensor histidine kinase
VTASIIEKIRISLMLNFEIVSAVNGEDAYTRFMQAPRDYKLIFMDIQMPVMNGYDSSRLMREYEEENKIEPPCYIVGLSGEESMAHERKCRMSQINEAITKPITRA